MTWRPSAALRNFVLEAGSLKRALSNCVLKVYTGSQPATAETAPSGTLLCTYSSASGSVTREVLAQGEIVVSGTLLGSLDTLTVNSISIISGALTHTGTISTFVDNIITDINNNPKNLYVVASKSGTDTVVLTAKPGTGVVTWAVASTETTCTVTDTAMGTLTAGTAPVNGLNWGDSAAGVLTKLSTQTWSGVAVATGTAGWFRIEAAVNDAGGADSTEAIIRADGAVATSGAELNMTPTSITTGATQTITGFTITLPTA